jgi:hypothetical protein
MGGAGLEPGLSKSHSIRTPRSKLVVSVRFPGRRPGYIRVTSGEIPGGVEDQERLRAELEKAQRTIDALRELAATRKLRYERSQEALDQLRKSLPGRTYREARRAFGLEKRELFCLFIGYPRSGHSLLGSLIDAHPDAAIAQGVNVLLAIAGGMRRADLVELLVRRAEEDSDRWRGRRLTGYSYAIPGQWQGQVRRLRVVGAKAGDKTTIRIRRDHAAFVQLRRMTRGRLRLLHVTRNPFDMIARIALTKADRTVGGATRFVGRLARTNAAVIADMPADVLTVRHESFVVNAREELRRIAVFLDLDPEEAWLDACASIVFDRPQRALDLVTWTPEQRDAVNRLIAQHAFFEGYSYS